MAMQWTVMLTSGDGNQARAEADLRRLLKVAGRRFNMRCAAVSEVRVVPGALRRPVGLGCGAGCRGGGGQR